MIKRTNTPTPNGGNYSVAFFCDKDWKPTTEKEATVVIVREFDEKNEMISETFLNKDS